MSKQIPLTQGKFAIVDDADYEWLNQRKWYYQHGYAVRSDYSTGKRVLILMHRLVTSAPDNMEVDHINQQRNDNRRENLRIVTTSQNQMNITAHRDSKSGIKGVWFCKNRWLAQIQTNGELLYLGRFLTIRSAVEAYNAAAIQYSGEHACLNDTSILPSETDPPKTPQSSNYHGVTLDKDSDKWRSRIIVNGQRKHIGRYLSEIEAARAYDTFVKEHGLNRPLNFPD